MLAVERSACNSEERSLVFDQTGVTGNDGIQQFVRDPLLYFSRWYKAGMNLRWPESGRGTHAQKEEEEVAKAVTSSEFRLHENAESCKSSLRAGTASIVLQQYTEEGVHFINLPVSQS